MRARYRLTTEEFLSWQTQVDRDGLQGLRATPVLSRCAQAGQRMRAVIPSFDRL